MAVEEKQKEYIIKSFYDILQALRENPDWAQQLRSLILTDELLKLPQKFDRFVEEEFRPLARRVERLEGGVERLGEGQQRLESRVERLEEGQKRLESRVERLEEGQKRLESRVERLEEGQKRLEEGQRRLEGRVERLEEGQQRLERDVAILKNKISKLEVDVGKLKGGMLEEKVRNKAPAYFGNYFRRVRVVPIEEMVEKLEDAVDAGIISEEDRKYTISLDILIRARTEDGRNVLLAVEVSYTLDDRDAERALRRANVISKVYNMETIPVVVGVNIPEGLQDRHPQVLVVQVSYDY